MPELKCRYTISEVSHRLGIQDHILRQWEKRFHHLRPRRTRSNRRVYTEDDVNIALRIKQLIYNEGLTTEGVIQRLDQEIIGAGRPRTRQEALDLIETIHRETRALIGLLDRDLTQQQTDHVHLVSDDPPPMDFPDPPKGDRPGPRLRMLDD